MLRGMVIGIGYSTATCVHIIIQCSIEHFWHCTALVPTDLKCYIPIVSNDASNITAWCLLLLTKMYTPD